MLGWLIGGMIHPDRDHMVWQRIRDFQDLLRPGNEEVTALIDVKEAYHLLSQTALSVYNPEKTETLETEHALGRTLTEEVRASYDHPAFDQSAMDGIAFRHQEHIGSLPIAGTIAAGDPPGQLNSPNDSCARIMTGAPVPANFDTVQMIEQVAIEGSHAKLLAIPERGRHIRFRGENVLSGQTLYEAGTQISTGVLAGLMSQGIARVKVRRPLRITIAATGNEIVDYRQKLQPGQIYNTNTPGVAALLRGPDTVVEEREVVSDTLEGTVNALQQQLDADLIVLSGGVSMGDYDLVPEAAKRAGFEMIFHKIKMKPGKPLWFGKHPSGTLLFGLPGNPVSTLVGTLLYIQPIVRTLACGVFSEPLWAKAVLDGEAANKGGLTLYRGVRLGMSAGQLQASLLTTSGSGDITGFSTFQSLARIPAQTRIAAGDTVDVLLSFPTGLS